MEIEKAEKIFSSLSNKSRIEIFKLLIAYNRVGICPSLLSKKLNIPINTISFHLNNLKNSGLVYTKKENKFIIYYCNTSLVNDLKDFLSAGCCSKNVRDCDNCNKSWKEELKNISKIKEEEKVC